MRPRMTIAIIMAIRKRAISRLAGIRVIENKPKWELPNSIAAFLQKSIKKRLKIQLKKVGLEQMP
jgi:hypothetical protein